MNIYDLNNISFSFINKHRERFDRFCRSWMIIIYCAITKARRAKTNHIYSAIKNTSQKYCTMKSTRGWRARTARFEPTCTLAIRIFVSFCFDMEMKLRIYCQKRWRLQGIIIRTDILLIFRSIVWSNIMRRKMHLEKQSTCSNAIISISEYR